MRIRKQQRQTDEGGIPNGPPRPSIEAVKGAIEQLSPRDRWLVALWMRTIYVQRPSAKPKPPKPPKTREEALGAKLRAYAAERRRELGLPEIPFRGEPVTEEEQREEDEMAVRMFAITNNGDPAIVMAPPPLPPFEIDEEKLKAAADAWARRKLGLDRPKRSKAKKTPMKRKAARR